jgi:hypothetical protein
MTTRGFHLLWLTFLDHVFPSLDFVLPASVEVVTG